MWNAPIPTRNIWCWLRKFFSRVPQMRPLRKSCCHGIRVTYGISIFFFVVPVILLIVTHFDTLDFSQCSYDHVLPWNQQDYFSPFWVFVLRRCDICKKSCIMCESDRNLQAPAPFPSFSWLLSLLHFVKFWRVSWKNEQGKGGFEVLFPFRRKYGFSCDHWKSTCPISHGSLLIFPHIYLISN